MNARGITALVLAGGRAERMGGMDKGWVELAGRPLIERVIERIAPQVGSLCISANRHADRYATLGYPVFADDEAGYLGPLAGVVTAMRRLASPHWLVVPCDTPFLPLDLVARLAATQAASGADIVVAADAAHQHNAVFLASASVLPGLEQHLASGKRSIGGWQGGCRHAYCLFDDESAFANVNSPDELARFAAGPGSAAAS